MIQEDRIIRRQVGGDTQIKSRQGGPPIEGNEDSHELLRKVTFVLIAIKHADAPCTIETTAKDTIEFGV
jgi:hypothetical protein